MIDLPFLGQLLVALLVVATLDGPSPVEPAPPEPAQAPPPQEPEGMSPLRGGWSAETDLHAQRLLRLEKRRDSLFSSPRTARRIRFLRFFSDRPCRRPWARVHRQGAAAAHGVAEGLRPAM